MSQPGHKGQEYPGSGPCWLSAYCTRRWSGNAGYPWGLVLGVYSALFLWALAWQIPQTLSRPLPGCWHKSKDKFQNARPPVCGDSNCLWLPEARHQGTTCCPLGCLAMVAAAWHYQPGAQGKEQRDKDRERAESSARLQTRKRDPVQWRSSGLCWKGTGWRVVDLTHGSTTLDRLLNFSSSLLPHPQNDRPSHTEVMK